jgi:voltage-gated potassium channel
VSPGRGGRRHPRRRILSGDILFSLASLLLIAGAVGIRHPVLIGVLLLAVAGGATMLQLAIPGGRLLSITFCNVVVLYAAGFAVARDTLFSNVSQPVLHAAFLLPLLGFFAGAYMQRRQIARQIAQAHRTNERFLVRGLQWLAVYSAIGIVALILADHAGKGGLWWGQACLLVGVALQSVLTFVQVRHASQLLIESGIVFRAFIHRAAALIVPAFAFVTFYLFLVVIFAAIYALADRISVEPSFIVSGAPAHLSFPQAVYFSVVTLSTVGYGDISPLSGIARFLVIVQIVMGLLLLLFGFAEITRHAARRQQPGGE